MLNDKILYTNKTVQVVLLGNNVECGDIISFSASLTNPDYFEAIGVTQYAYRNIDYTAIINYSDIDSIQKSKLSIKESLKDKALDILNSYMSPNSANLAYAVVFGDKTYLDYDTRNAFIESGIAHVLAVSGLHTSLIFALLIMLLKKVRIRYGYKLTIIALFIGFFTYLCDFAPSIVRASIMALILAFTYLRSSKYDIINILSLAGVVILLFQPLQLFNVGFVLSFACMFSMILFDPIGNKMTNFIPNSQIQSLFVSSITTTFGTLPVMAIYFGKLSLTCVIANVILLPIFVYAYTFLFVAVVLSLFLPLPFLLHGLDYVLTSITHIASFITLPKNDYIRIFKLDLVGEILSFILLFTITKRFNAKPKLKIVLNVVLLACVTLCAIFASVPKAENGKMVQVKDSGYVYYLNSDCSVFEPFATNSIYNQTKNYLSNNNLYSIDNLFILSYNFVNVQKMQYFTSEFNIKNVYISPACYDDVKEYLDSYFTSSNICILQDGQTYDANEYEFLFCRITDKSSYIAIQNGEEYYKLYSENAYL